jgi:hypothetical protein
LGPPHATPDSAAPAPSAVSVAEVAASFEAQLTVLRMERAALPAALDRLFLCYKGKGPGQVCAVSARGLTCVLGGGGAQRV